ncbi:MAG TPA: FmdB family zinc ribbon protein [Variovorax sp.]
MPIYAYKCSACGFAKDVLQKLSDSPLTECPSCGEGAFSKQLTAAGFQLKGSGWYVTDFRDGGAAAKKGADGGAKGSDGADSGADKSGEKSAEKNGSTAPAGAGAPAADKPAAAPASGPAAAPAAAPSPGASD